MPELPEVETIRLGLEPYVLGRSIEKAEVLHPRVTRRSPSGLTPVVGKTIHSVARRGKYLWMLTEDSALIAHLGMSGQFRIGNRSHPHLRASFLLDDGTVLGFVDQRTFGHLLPDELVPTADGGPGGFGSNEPFIPRTVSHIGRDVLDPLVDFTALARRVKAKNTEIKRVLLDQSVAAGIGNIYADEALWLARTHPRRNTARMSIDAIVAVYQAAKHVMTEAVRVGGTSFDKLYVNVNGESGYFDRSLHVYGRTGSVCDRDDGGIIVREPFMGRSSHYCPRCQRRR